MPRITPSEVKYLALQGGGGKGFAYIGAIEALEGFALLPKDFGGRAGIEGISGASVGGILALLLAIGCTSKDLLKIFCSNSEFLKFFDAPETGFARAIRPGNWQARKAMKERWIVQGLRSGHAGAAQVTKALHDLNAEIDDVLARIGFSSTKMSGATLLALWMALSPAGKWSADLIKSYPFLGPVARDPSSYVANMLYDRGLYPGFTVRDFLRRTVRHYLTQHPQWKRQIADPADITFEELKDTTGYDLVIVGTNLSQRKSVYFSARTTPRFQVVEAVGISACFPIVFKPIWIEAESSDPILGPLRGYWIDGGLLNNIPLHAFDAPAPNAPTKPRTAPIPVLNPNVIGLALRPGAPNTRGLAMPSDEDPLSSFGADLLETALMPSGPGQYATDQERSQVIEIFSYELSLFDFAPSAAAGRLPRETAYDQVVAHFLT